jgi:hypothetical protein
MPISCSTSRFLVLACVLGLPMLPGCVSQAAPYEFHHYSQTPIALTLNPYEEGPIHIPFFEDQRRPVRSNPCDVWGLAHASASSVELHFPCGFEWVFDASLQADPGTPWVIEISGFDDASAELLVANASGSLGGTPQVHTRKVGASPSSAPEAAAEITPMLGGDWVVTVSYKKRSVRFFLGYQP